MAGWLGGLAGWWPGWLPRRHGWLAGGGLEAWLRGTHWHRARVMRGILDAPTVGHKSASDTNCSPKKGKKRGEKRKKEKIAGKKRE